MKANFEENIGSLPPTSNGSLLSIFLQQRIRIPVLFGIVHLIFNYYVYRQEKRMTNGPPSFYPFVNICICTLLFMISPVIKYVGPVIFQSWQFDCSVYAFSDRLFIALLPLSMLEILVETCKEGLIENNRKLKVKIFICVWILAFWFALPGVWLEEYYVNPRGECILRTNPLLDYFGRLFYIEQIKMWTTFMYLVFLCFNMRQPRFGDQQNAVEMESEAWRRRWSFLYFIFGVVFWMIPSLYLVLPAFLEPVTFELALFEGMTNGYQCFYWAQLILLPFIFSIARMIFAIPNSGNLVY